MLPKLSDPQMASERERMALDFADRLATDHAGIDDPFMARLRERFTDAEIVELGLITGAFIMLGRLHRTFGVAAMAPNSHRVLADG